jgi:hypothetical protein
MTVSDIYVVVKGEHIHMITNNSNTNCQKLQQNNDIDNSNVNHQKLQQNTEIDNSTINSKMWFWLYVAARGLVGCGRIADVVAKRSVWVKDGMLTMIRSRQQRMEQYVQEDERQWVEIIRIFVPWLINGYIGP